MDKKEIASRFKPVRPVSKMAEQILKKRYYKEGEKAWEDVANRVVDDIASDWNEDDKEIIRQMIINRYMVPNSPADLIPYPNSFTKLSSEYSFSIGISKPSTDFIFIFEFFMF